MKTVFVVGAGPAGMFAAQKIAQGGHVPVSSQSAVSISDLQQFGPSAIVFAVGAQGTKKLGLPGEEVTGVYAAKDFVYSYNLLPPFTSRDFSTGKRVAIIGMGNVMVDIARWLLIDSPVKTAEEVVVVARRGPFEAKFDKKEFDYIEEFLDRRAFDEELRRIQPQLSSIGQDISKLAEETFPVLATPATEHPTGKPRLRFRFLCSPQAIHAGADGRIDRLTVAENVLLERDGSIACKATDKSADLDVDTMIFAIGDVADPAVGLPYSRDSYVINPDQTDPKRAAYELFDPQSGKVLDGMYAVGWARKASDGLVGIARHDAEVGAVHVLKYLETASESNFGVAAVQDFLRGKGLQIVTKADLESLARAEEKQAQKLGALWFKFAEDNAMLAAIKSEKANAVSV